MKSYNGFTAEQREEADQWLNEQWKKGNFPKPTRCCACGQTSGRIDAHTEDYSKPFALGKTDKYPLCFRCHMMVHCRFKHPDAWNKYKDDIAAGKTFKPAFSFQEIIDQMLTGSAEPIEEDFSGKRIDNVFQNIEQESKQTSMRQKQPSQ